MAEQIDLTTPQTFTSTVNYRITFVAFDVEGQSINVRLKANNNERFVHTISGATAVTLMNQLNTANLTANSLFKRIMTRLIADGVLAGSISGSPD